MTVIRIPMWLTPGHPRPLRSPRTRHSDRDNLLLRHEDFEELRSSGYLLMACR